MLQDKGVSLKDRWGTPDMPYTFYTTKQPPSYVHCTVTVTPKMNHGCLWYMTSTSIECNVCLSWPGPLGLAKVS